jgi:hypothetical protein
MLLFDGLGQSDQVPLSRRAWISLFVAAKQWGMIAALAKVVGIGGRIKLVMALRGCLVDLREWYSL